MFLGVPGRSWAFQHVPGRSKAFQSAPARSSAFLSAPGGLQAAPRCKQASFLEPFARSEPKKSNPASQGNDDVQKMRTLRAPDLSKVHLGAGGEKLKILTSKFVLEIDFFDHGFF